MATAIVGANWGDEGKGKMTDMLAAQSDVVVRYQGGSNAGHTIINDKGRFALHLLPSGVFYENVINIIGTGVAFNTDAFTEELEGLHKAGVYPDIRVSDRAQVLLDMHKKLDAWEEARLAGKSFGSTKSGIAPFYSDKYSKIGFQICELYYPDLLRERIKTQCDRKNPLFTQLYGQSPLGENQLLEQLLEQGERIKPYVADTGELLYQAYKAGKGILLEGQLGALKDPDAGIYPFVTSSSPLAGFASCGAGLPPYAIDRIIAVVKCYSSAVGAGPFVTEIFDEQGDELRRRGGDKGEFGATTGRPRRMGWFDAVATRYGCRAQGATEVALTLLDVLSYLDEIPVCVAYEYRGARLTGFPVTPMLGECKPVLKTLKGWKEDIRGIREFDRLPQRAREYVEFVEKAVGVRVSYVSNGPKREDIIFRGTGR